MHSEIAKKMAEVRSKFLGIKENSSVKSYYPQLKEKIIELEENELFLKDKSKALLNILEDLEVEKKKTQESEEKYRRFFEEDLSGVFISTPEGKMKACNPAYARMMEYDTVEELLASNPFEHYEQSQDRIDFLNLLRKKKKLIDYEGAIITRKGKHIDTLENVIGVFDDNNKLIELLGYVNDITARKKAEKVLKNAATEKEALHRELLHRVKNSFALIKSLIYLERQRLDNEETNKILEELEHRVGSLAHMYSLLNETGVSQQVELDHYLRQISKSLTDSFIEDNQKVIIITEFDNIIVSPKDASSIGLIINELLTNSLKYAFDNASDGELTITAKLENDNVILVVSDNGRGFPIDFKIEDSTGMGLELVKMLVQQLSGTMVVESKNGTTFKIVIPIKQ